MIKDNLIQLFEDSFRENWDSTALSEYTTSKRLTYGELARDIMRFHVFYENFGIQRGQKIAVCGKNSIAWASCYLATLTYGAVIVPILDEFNPTDIDHILNHCEAKLIFVDENIAAKLDFRNLPMIKGIISLEYKALKFHEGSDMKRQLQSINAHMGRKYPRGFTKKDLKFHHRDNSSLATICYTSGTTSLTKGVMLTLNNLAGNVMFAINKYNKELGVKMSTVLCMLPLAHTYINSFSFLYPLSVGSNITILGKIPSPKIVTAACKKVKPSLLIVVPLVLEKIYHNKLKPLISKPIVRIILKIPVLGNLFYRYIGNKLYKQLGGRAADVIAGGAALNPEVEDFFKKTKFPFLVGYGMTECAPLISYSHHTEFKVRSVGKVIPNMEVRILKEKETDETGEILVRGENVMIGYYKDDEATKATFTEDGWLKTGDLGYLDNDGFIYISGRSKTMLLGPNGENIYPESIESKLQNLPLVSECIVIQNSKHKIEAWVYPDYEIINNMKLNDHILELAMEDNRRTLNYMLARYEAIMSINILNEPMPKTPKRTVKRYAAIQQIEQQKLSESHE